MKQAMAVTMPGTSGKVVRQVNDFEEMCSLYNELTSRCSEIYGQEDALMQVSEGIKTYSNQRIQTYMMVVNTRKSILAEMAKMRQSDHIINMAAQFIIEDFIKRLVDKLTNEFNALGESMRRAGVEKSTLQAFEVATTRRLAELIESEADAAMDSTRKEFRLQ